MFDSGFWTVGRFAGAPVRLHWSVLLLMLYFGGWQPGAWVGIITIVLVHELGHAAIVRAVRARVTEVMVYGFGGYCRWEGRVSSREHAMIAWGGVVAQAFLFVIAWSYKQFFPIDSVFMLFLLHTFLGVNLWIIGFNLIPIAPLDGASAWPLIPILRDDLRRWWANRRSPPPTPRAPPAKREEAKPPNVVPIRPSGPEEDVAAPNRVTDPDVADRMFRQVYDGLVSTKSPPQDPRDPQSPQKPADPDGES